MIKFLTQIAKLENWDGCGNNIACCCFCVPSCSCCCAADRLRLSFYIKVCKINKYIEIQVKTVNT